MVDKEILEVLGVSGQRKQLDIQWFGGRAIQEPTILVDLYVNGRGLGKKHKLRNVYGVSNLNLPTQTLLEKDLVNLKSSDKFNHLLYYDVTPKLLIGLDHCHLGLPTKTMGIGGHGPYAANTELGWVIFGPSNRASNPNATCLMVCSPKESELHDMVADYFETENFGVKAVSPIPSAEDIRAKEILEATTQQINGRFQVGLLWKTDDIVLPESYTMALKRLCGIERKMKRNVEFATAYKEIIESYLRKGYARKLLAEEATTYHPRNWYLPHFAVLNPNKPTKLRLVFDAAAFSNGTSLNSNLLKGPQDYRPLPAILFHFREGPVAVCGDVMEMFHQVVVQPNDRCAQRFLWRGGDDTKPPDVFEMVSMTFGAACSPCAAHYVKTMNALQHRNADNLRAVKAILEYHYVDDFVDSFESVAEAIKVTKQVCDIHKRAGFTLRHFASNSPDVSKSLGCDEVALNIQRKESFSPEKVLGMYWRPSSDDFNFEVKFNYTDKTVLDGLRSPTKRELLSIVMSIFDPIGFLCHFTIVAKLILREVWSYRVRWDEDIPVEVNSAWERFRKQIPNVTQCHIPRPYFDNKTIKQLQLHIFVDASEHAFAAVGYWRYTTDCGKIGMSFVSAKTKTAPLKPLTIPRLELQAAVLGVRLKKIIFQEHSLKINEFFLWSDSSTVLHWINSEHRRYKPFVAHSVAEILDESKPSNWRWVPTADNAADEATRAKGPIDFSPSSCWFSGPTFLKDIREHWPVFVSATKVKTVGNDDEEIKPRFALMVARNTLIDFNQFSSFTKLRRTIAYILRFISRCRKQKRSQQTYGLTAEEIEKAQITLSRLVQRETYAVELHSIALNQPVSRDSELHQLSPYVDEDGVLRVYGRIDAATWLPRYVKRPIILPPGHEVTKLIVAFKHNKMFHQNTEATIAEIRRTFWIPRLRQVLRSVVTNCVVCKVSKAKPVAPLMGSLPQDRLTPFVRPFTFTGLDYFGPINVAIGRRTEKRWVALFTCLTVRAIHLELAQDLSTDACILCIRNFINRRGVPARLRSDNGTNFIGADKEAKKFTEVFDCEKIQDELSSRGVQWIFNWPSNPSEGGAWERMVQCVKRALWHTLKEESPREHTLISVLIEVENVVNSRPLTHVPVSSEEEEPLTPNHLLLGSENTANTPSVEDPIKKLCTLRKQWRISRQYRDRFWKRWIAEYLPTLTRRVRWCRRARALQVGDLVLICEASTPRSGWCRGRVVQVYRGTDGEVRRADVRTCGGMLRRPVSKLAILDVADE
ncbi:uncharacterized protein LOC118733830 [Rhagoletis pomonella]|uniref:uncharacterized protein LOC118733830 n=1 Tax=Rhagoletis pomonella TaxID=28610 RepID=UPI001782587C|nr:uncharacterized protein LOC118733830 [Rhagoletis pomonella]